jgi:hypothetical protein
MWLNTGNPDIFSMAMDKGDEDARTRKAVKKEDLSRLFRLGPIAGSCGGTTKRFINAETGSNGFSAA